MEGIGFDLSKMTFKTDKDSFSVTPHSTHDEITHIIPRHLAAIQQKVQSEEKQECEWTVSRDRCFFGFTLRPTRAAPTQMHLLPLFLSPSSMFVDHIEDVIHVLGLRGNPKRTYPKTAVGPSFPGTFENYTASLVARWQEKDKAKLDSLGKALEHLESRSKAGG
jgi:hypothetical protein